MKIKRKIAKNGETRVRMAANVEPEVAIWIKNRSTDLFMSESSFIAKKLREAKGREEENHAE